MRRRAAWLFVAPILAVSPPANAQEVDWQGEMQRDIRNVLSNHYLRDLTSDVTSVMCLAERGDTCFGGDHEDFRCLRVVPCRSRAVMSQFRSALRRAVERRPDDPWAVAQAVYAFSRLGDPDTAVELAGQCEAATWWCNLVLASAYQRAGPTRSATSRYMAALAGADRELVCLLTDISELLEGRDRATYASLPCPGPQRRRFEDRFWWLSDPFLSRPGNDRWTEHLTRRFELLLHDRLRKAVSLAMREQYVTPPGYIIDVVRRGHPDSWRPAFNGTELWTSEAGARYRFTPASIVGDGLQALTYELEAGRWDEGYTPAGYGPVQELPAQFGRFLEGDSLVVAAAADLGAASVVADEIWFLASAGPLGPVHGPPPARGPGNPTFTVMVAPQPLVAAIEVFGRSGAAARARKGLLPLKMDGLAISDVLLVDPPDSGLPASREEAVRSMRPRTRIGNAAELVAYWEIYGVEADRMVQIGIALERGGEGMLTRVLRTLGGQTGEAAPTVSWRESVGGPAHPVSVTVDVGALEPGEYELRIEVTGPTGSTATTTRSVRLS